ncbi:MAG: hypothetical protein ABI333_03030 [bacterium]
MRTPKTTAWAVLGSVLLAAYACDVQPGRSGGPAEAPGVVAPVEPSAKLKPEPRHPVKPVTKRPPIQPAAPASVEGPKDTKPAPLPKADKVLAIFHSGNVDGELDPCG